MAQLESFKWCTQVHGGGGGYNTADNIREAKFGNGYRQVASSGYNTSVRTFPIVYAGKEPEFSDVEKFVFSHLLTPFAWKTPRGDLGVFLVKPNTINVKPMGDETFELTCQFEEFFTGS